MFNTNDWLAYGTTSNKFNNTYIQGILDICGNITLRNGGFSLNGDVSMNGNLYVGLDTTIRGNSNIQGNLVVSERILQRLSSDPSYNTVNGYYALAKQVQPIVSQQTAYDIGQNWQNATSGVLENAWNSVCFSGELGLFCAVASSGTTNQRVMISNDGLNWQNATSGVVGTTTWNSICWSRELGIFCAVGTTTTTNVDGIMISSNGSTWTNATSYTGDTGKPWRGVCWAAELGTFCAVSGHGTTMVSRNGRDWVQTALLGTIFLGICWSPELGIFCAIGNNFQVNVNTIMISRDGYNWSFAKNFTTGLWNSVCWSPELGLFCMVTLGNIGISKDGLNWTFTTIGVVASIIWDSVCWAADIGLFCAVANSGNTNQRVIISKDGITWNNSITGVVNSQWTSVCWSPELSMFCGVANAGTTNQRVMITNPNYRLPTTKSLKTLLNDDNYNINIASTPSGTFPNFRTTATGPNLINIGNGNYKLVAGALRDSIAIGNTILNASNPNGYGMIGMGQNVFPELTTGFQNIGIGNAIATSMTTGYNNVFIGNSVATSTTSTGNTVAIGTNAGRTNITGINNTYLGAFTNENAAGYNNSTALGYGATITASNQIKLGTSSERVDISGNLNVTGLTSLFGYFTTTVIGLSYIRGTTNLALAINSLIPIGTSTGYNTLFFNTVGAALSGGVFTAPITGYYFIYANVYFTNGAGYTIRLNATTSTNGTELGGNYTQTTTAISSSATVIRRLTTGETIRFYTNGTTGCSLNTRTDPNFNGNNCIIYLLYAN